jgi:predicted ribosome quality control (RQC) complex YloA/Tae2 family protein
MALSYGKVKKSLSSLDVAVIINELSELIVDSRIDNVFRLNEDSLLLKLILKEGKHAYLVVEGGVRVSLTTHPGTGGSGGRVPLFRRYLREGVISRITQHMFERIVVFEIRGREDLRLVAELLPRGIVAVVDSSGKVLVSTKDLSARDRTVRPGLPYVFPPVLPDIRGVSSREFVDLLRREREVGRALVKVFGVPPEVVNEVLEESLRKASPSTLSDEDLVRVHDIIKSFIEGVVRKPEPVIIACNDSYVSFHPFQPRRLEGGCRVISFKSFNEAVDEYFQFFEGRSAEVVEEVEERDRISLTLSKARENYEEMIKTREELVGLVKLVQEHYDLLESIWECVSVKVRSSGWESVTSCNVSSYDKDTGSYEVVLEGRTLNFSILKDFKTQYFDLLRRLKNLEEKIKKTEEVLKNLEERLRVLDSVIEEKTRKIPVVRSFQWYHVYHWVITRNGFLAVGGRDAAQNEKIVRKLMKDRDIFMHADIQGAPVFLVFTEGREVPEEDLYEVAVLAASYSKAWKEKLRALDVFWVSGSQVGTAAPAGQYLPKGSFMVYGKKNYIRDVELRVSIGIQVRDDKYYELVAGPPELLKSRCCALITLEPGDAKPEIVAKEFMELLRKTKYLVKDLKLDDVIRYVPGPSNITEKMVVG